jgi:hypothetical protein
MRIEKACSATLSRIGHGRDGAAEFGSLHLDDG